MNFAALPPEINSGLMYSGSGPGPMLTAAAAWNGLAAELHSAATSYASVVSELTDGAWLGPSSASMAASIAPFVTWLNTTAIQAEKTATQAKAAVAAYEAAFAMTVPPPAIAANRAQLMMLLATNVLGQNAPAIAATEALYGEMWAQDATAMYGYASTSATAAELEPFQPPPQTTNPAGPLSQAAAVQQAWGNSAGSNAQTLPSQLASALPGAASSEATTAVPVMPLQAAPPTGFFEWLGIVADETAVGIALPLSVLGVYLAGAAMYYAELDSREILDTQDVLAGGQQSILDALGQLGATAELPSTERLRVPHPSVVTGEAFSAGGLSVPQSWVEAAPEIRAAGYSTSGAATPLAASPGGMGTAFGQMALAGMGGSALAGALNRGRAEHGKPAATTKSTVAPPPIPGSPKQPPESPAQSPVSPVAELAAGIRELGELHDAGYLTETEFAEQKQRLLGR